MPVIRLMVVIPALLIGQQLVLQAAKGAEVISSNVESGDWRRAVEAQPLLAPLAARLEQLIDVPGTVQILTRQVTVMTGAVLKGSAVQLVSFCLIFYVLFFFLRDRAALLQAIRSVVPLTQQEADLLLERVAGTVHAMIYGTLVVASIQGLLGGLMFWWLDLSAPLLWGTVMAGFSIVPVLGAFVVWIPGALFLALEGQWASALVLALWGIFVVSTIDNLLRPILVGKRLKMHTVLVFISVVGGLVVFGAAGLILGPVTLTTTAALLEIRDRRDCTQTGSAAGSDAS